MDSHYPQIHYIDDEDEDEQPYHPRRDHTPAVADSHGLFIRQGAAADTELHIDLSQSDDDDEGFEEVRISGSNTLSRSFTGSSRAKSDSVLEWMGQKSDRKRKTSPGAFANEDYMTEEEFNAHLADLSLQDRQSKSYKRDVRSTPRASPSPISGSFLYELPQPDGTIGKINLKAGKSVQLRDGTFLRITSLQHDRQDNLLLRGRPLALQKECAPMLPKQKRELLWKVDVLSDGSSNNKRIINEITVDAGMVKNVCLIVFTNVPASHKEYQQVQAKVEKQKAFCCRRKIIQIDLTVKTVAERALGNLTFEECDVDARLTNVSLRSAWRGVTALGGSHKQTVHHGNVIILDHDDDDDGYFPDQNESSITKYTFGDGFCGAGGVSRGAKQAGLKVKFGFDMDRNAIESYRDNFKRDGTIGFKLDVSQFLAMAGKRFMVDILHLSPPCQPYSAAHTTSQNVQRDEDNQAVLFSTWQLVEQLKPRIVTMEETEGLYARHPQYFYSLVHTFMDHGYSVRWRIVNTYHYGVPQSRRRIYLYAAG